MKVAQASKKILGASVLAFSLVVLPTAFPAAAQTDTNRPTLDTTPFQETRDDNNNWGWLGLIGLIGLANLFRQPKSRTVHQDPNVTTRTTYRE